MFYRVFKKVLCWLLIFQHVNVYVLHAAPGDIRILFERLEDEQSSSSRLSLPKKPKTQSSSSRRLTILREKEHTNEELKYTFDLDSFGKFNPASSLPTPFGDIKIEQSLDYKRLHLVSALKGNEFSLHLKPDGTFLVQHTNFLNHLNIHTFGKVFLGDSYNKQEIKVKELSVTGKGILNYAPLFVEKLNLSGKKGIKNTSEGRIHIDQHAHIWKGNFVNEGRIFGEDQSYMDLHGNDFINAYIGQTKSSPFKSQINWSGGFSIEDVGTFTNNSSMSSEEAAKYCGLHINSKTFRNRGDITSPILNLNCTGDAFNEDKGTLSATENLLFSFGNSLMNRGQIRSMGRLEMAGTTLMNLAEKDTRGKIEANHLIMTLEKIQNQGLIIAHKIVNFNIEEFVNFDSGIWILPEKGKSIAEKFKNTHKILGEAFDMTVGVFQNFGKIISLGNLTIEIRKFFKNETGALMASLNGFTLMGTGEAQNQGIIASRGKINIDTKEVSNKGQIVSEKDVTIHTRGGETTQGEKKDTPDFTNEGLVLSPNITVETQNGVSTGLVNETIDFNKTNELQGLVAEKSLKISASDTFTNNGHAFGGTIVELLGAGKFENTKVLNSNGFLISSIKGFDNKGNVFSKVGTLSGTSLHNAGSMHLDKTSTITFHDIQGFEDSKFSSKEGLTFEFYTLGNKGIIETGRFTTFEGRDFNNEGEVYSEVLRVVGLGINTDKTVLQENFTNSGVFHGSKNVEVRTSSLINEDEVSSGGALTFEVGSLFTNGQDGVVFSRGDFVVKGKGEVENGGHLEGQGKVHIYSVKTKNLGSIIGDESITIDTQGGKTQHEGEPDFTNHGLVLSSDIIIKSIEGMNTGTFGEEIDFDRLGKTKGLVASNTLSLVTEKEFTNVGSIFGETAINLSGSGTFDNKNHLRSHGALTALTTNFKNEGIVSSFKDGTFKGQGEAYNEGCIESHGKINIDFKRTTNRGQIASDELVNIYTRGEKTIQIGEKEVPDFTNEGLVISPVIIVEMQNGVNRGSINETIDLNKTDEIQGLVAENTLHITTHGRFTNDGHSFGGSGVELLGSGIFENKKALNSNGALTSTISYFDNKGNVLARSGKLEGNSLHNSGSMHLHETSSLRFKDIRGLEESEFTSKEGLTFGFATLGNKGIIEADKFTIFEGRDFKNEGEVHSEVLKAVGSGTNTDKTTLQENFTNNGVFYGSKNVEVNAQNFKNEDEVSSGGSLTVESTHSFTNEKGSLVAATEAVIIKGVAEIQNRGNIESQDKIDISSRKTVNTGQMIAENEIHIRTKKVDPQKETTEKLKDFENEGLVMSSKIILQTDTGSNVGLLNKAIDIEITDDLKGLLASDTLNLKVGDKFTNTGHMVGGKTLKLEGAGTFENEENGTLNKSDTIESHLKGLNNKGTIHAHQFLALDQLTQNLTNTGLLLSEGKVSIDSTSKFVNTGIIEGRKGDVSLTMHELENQGLMTSLGGKLLLNTDKGQNQSLIYGQEGIALTTKGLFTNDRAENSLGRIESQKDIKILGSGDLDNKGFINSKEFLDVQTTKIKNYKEGKILSQNEISTTTQSFDNAGLIQGQAASITTTEQFVNEGEIAATTGIASFTLQGGTNGGILRGSEKVDMSLGQAFENNGKILSPKMTDIHGTGRVENKGSLIGDQSLEIREVQLENGGTLSSLQNVSLHHLQGTLMNQNSGQIVSEGTLTVTDTQSFHNFGHSQGKIHTSINVTDLQNMSEISSPEGSVHITSKEGMNGKDEMNGKEGIISAMTDLKLDIQKTFTNDGTMGSEGSCSLLGKGVFTNNNLAQSKGMLTTDLSNLINNKEIKAGQAELHVGTLTNSNDILVEDSLVLDVQKGTNTGDIQAKIFTVNLKTPLEHLDSFENKKTLHATETFTIKGEGSFFNEKDLISDGSLTLQNKSLTNRAKAQVQAKNKLEILGSTHVENELGANILSQSSIEMGEQTTITNQGLISGETITFKQPSYESSGTLEATGDIFLPNSKTLKNKEGGIILSKEGQISLPQVQVVENEGSFLSQKTVDFPELISFINSGSFRSNERVDLTSSGDINNSDKLVGRTGVSLKGKKVSNQGDVISEGSIGIQGVDVETSRLISGSKNVSVVAAQTLTQGANSKIESAEGTIKIEAPQLNLQGEISGKNVEIHPTGASPFSLNGAKITPLETLTLQVPYGWDLKGQPKTFGHSVHLTGPILNPSSLHIKGDFTWDNPNGLANKFDMIVEGILTLRINGVWTNLANVQGQKGTHVTATQFLNQGTFYSYGKTVFDCPNGFDNYSQMKVEGDCDILAKCSSIKNHPSAQFYQKNIKQNLVKFEAAQDVANINGDLHIQGKITIDSSNFSNKLEKPKVENLPDTKNHVVRKKVNGITERKTVYGKKEAKKEIPVFPQGAFFSAGEAIIRAATGENIGSTISTDKGITFNGRIFINRTYKFVEDGKVYAPTGKMIAKKGNSGHGLSKSSTKSTQLELALVPYSKCTDSDPKSFIATIYSKGAINIENIQNDEGFHRGERGNYSGSCFENINDRLTLNFSKSIPRFSPVAKYFDSSKLQGPSFWKKDTQKNTGFTIIPNTPIHLPSAQEISEQLRPTSSSKEEITNFVKDLETKLSLAFGEKKTLATEETSSDFWRLREEDLSTFEHSLTPNMLVQVPPRIALIGDASLIGRMHHHPALLAELVTKTFLDTIGFASISQKIYSPELLTRVLEEMGYVNARKLHNRGFVPTPPNWETLPPQTQIAQQQRELITHDETEKFEDPAIVYRVWEDFGERVQSALVIFPKSIREAFKVIPGRILATYLSIETKEVKNLGGSIIGKKALYIKTDKDLLNDEGTIGSQGLTGLKIGGTASNLSGTMDGNEISVEGHNFISSRKTTRENFQGGYRDKLHEKALLRAHTGNLKVKAHNLLHATGTGFEAEKNVDLLGEKGVVIGAQQTEFDISQSGKRFKYHRHTTTNHKSTIQGKNVNITSGGNALFKGLDVVAKEKINVLVEGTHHDEAVSDHTEEESSNKSENKGLFRKKSETKTQTETSTPQGNTLTGNAVTITAKGDVHLQGTQINSAPNKSTIRSLQGKVFLEGAMSSYFTSKQRTGNSLVWRSQQNKGENKQVLVMTKLSKGTTIGSKQGIIVDVGVQKAKKGRRKPPLPQTLNQLEKNPDLDWIKQLRNKPNVKWNIVQEEYKEWNKKSQGLSVEATAILGLAVAIATSGTGAALLGVAASSLEGIAASSLFTSLTSQAITSLANNKGNILKTFEDLSSSQSLRGLALSVGTATITGGLLSQMNVSPNSLNFTDQVQTQAVQTGISTGVSVITQDLSLKEATQQGATNMVGGIVGSYGAQKIGEAYHPTNPNTQPISGLEQKALHFVNGMLPGALSNRKNPFKGALSGGTGAFMAETLAEVMAPSKTEIQKKAQKGTLTKDDLNQHQSQMRRAADMGRMGAALTSLLLKQDVNASILGGTNAVENNFGLHSVLGGKDWEGLQRDADKFINITLEGIENFGEEGRGLGESFADALKVDGLPKEYLEKTGKSLGLGIGVGINAIGIVRGKNSRSLNTNVSKHTPNIRALDLAIPKPISGVPVKALSQTKLSNVNQKPSVKASPVRNVAEESGANPIKVEKKTLAQGNKLSDNTQTAKANQKKSVSKPSQSSSETSSWVDRLSQPKHPVQRNDKGVKPTQQANNLGSNKTKGNPQKNQGPPSTTSKPTTLKSQNDGVSSQQTVRNSPTKSIKKTSEQPKADTKGQNTSSTKVSTSSSKNKNQQEDFHITYSKQHPEDGVPYWGRAKGKGNINNQRDIDKAIKTRDRNHHMNEKGFGKANLDKVSKNPNAIRGHEQLQIDKSGGAQSKGGISSNKINSISDKNPKKNIYIEEAKMEFGEN